MPALESIEVEGYRSIRAAKIDLGPVNVLIGAHGSGKSNLLGVFGLLADLVDQRLQLHIGRQGGADAILHFGRKKTPSLRMCTRFGGAAYEAVLVPARVTRWSSRPRWRGLGRRFDRCSMSVTWTKLRLAQMVSPWAPAATKRRG